MGPGGEAEGWATAAHCTPSDASTTPSRKSTSPTNPSSPPWRFPRNPPKLPLSRPTLRLHDPTPLHQKALHLKKTQDPPEEARKRFAALVTIQSTSRTANGPSDHIKSFERGDLKLPPSAGLAWYPGGVDVISETGHVSQLTRIQTQIGILPPAETRRRRRHALPLPHPSILGL